MFFISFKTYRITFPSLRAEASFLNIVLAIVGRRYEVDKVCVLVVLVPHVLGHQHAPSILPLLLHLVCPIKLLFQHCSDLKWDVMKCCWNLINLKNSKMKWSHLTNCHQLKNLSSNFHKFGCKYYRRVRSLSWVALNEATPTGTATKHAIDGWHTKAKLVLWRQVKVAHFNRMPILTIRKEARDRQQVLSSQDPLTPWHLHSTFMFLSSNWKIKNN